VIRWQHQSKPELKAEGDSHCTIELEPIGPAVKLSITHTIEREPSKLIVAVSGGWPKIILQPEVPAGERLHRLCRTRTRRAISGRCVRPTTLLENGDWHDDDSKVSRGDDGAYDRRQHATRNRAPSSTAAVTIVLVMAHSSMVRAGGAFMMC